MKPISKGFETELWFHRWTGQVQERDNYLVVSHPENPKYLWGNLLYFQNSPSSDEIAKWIDCFRQEFKALPQVRHATFSWEDDTILPESKLEFERQNFIIDGSVTLILSRKPQLKHYNNQIKITEVRSDQQWDQVFENQVSVRSPNFEEKEYRAFFSKKLENYKCLVQTSRGRWFAAYVDDILVADLGIFYCGKTGRVQRVATSPKFRRQGIASTLLYHSINTMISECSLEEVIILADPNYHAMDLYQSLGFEPEKHQFIVYKPVLD